MFRADDLVSFSGYQFPSEVRERGDVSVIQSTKAPKRNLSAQIEKYPDNVQTRSPPSSVKNNAWPTKRKEESKRPQRQFYNFEIHPHLRTVYMPKQPSKGPTAMIFVVSSQSQLSAIYGGAWAILWVPASSWNVKSRLWHFWARPPLHGFFWRNTSLSGSLSWTTKVIGSKRTKKLSKVFLCEPPRVC